MSEKIVVPALGESVTEATVSKWLKNEGDKVNSDEPVVELETDKVNVEVPSPTSGILDSISVQEGQTVNVGALLGSISSSVNSNQSEVKEIKKYAPPPQKKELKEEAAPLVLEEESKPNIEPSEEEPLILDNVEEELKTPTAEKNVSPAARKMAAESKINLDDISGSGKNGTVLKEDLMNLMGTNPTPSERKKVHGPEERIKMTRLRMTIAKRLKEAQENAAMLTTFNEVDMHEVISMRNNYKEEFQKNIRLN